MILRNNNLLSFRSGEDHLLYLYISQTQFNSPPVLSGSREALALFAGKITSLRQKYIAFCFVVCFPQHFFFLIQRLMTEIEF